MPSHAFSVVKFETGHVLFIGIVGYSKLLIEERKERVGSPRLCWRLHRLPSPSMNNSLGLQPAMEWRWVYSLARRNR
jgi:hypothetical protein